jgi:shikimate kinase
VTNQTIVIIGFMGSGKTTVGNALARLLDCRALDLDSFITECEQRGPKEIIEQDGEEAFRRIETRALREVLLEASAGVITVGGGAWNVAENRKLIAIQKAFTVWLDPSFELCWKRIESDAELRPLAPSRGLAQTLYAARRPVYELANARVPVYENESAEEIAKQVARAAAWKAAR